MSINSAVFAPGSSSPLLVVGREQLLTQSDKVELVLTTSSAPNAPGNFSFDKGSIFVTALRLIYVPNPQLAGCSSVVLPLDNVRSAKLEQPLFGANYWTCQVAIVPGCGLPAVPFASVKLTFNSGGASNVHQVVLRSTGGMAGLDHTTNPVLNPSQNIAIFTPFQGSGAPLPQPVQPTGVQPAGYYLDAAPLPPYQPMGVPMNGQVFPLPPSGASYPAPATGYQAPPPTSYPAPPVGSYAAPSVPGTNYQAPPVDQPPGYQAPTTDEKSGPVPPPVPVAEALSGDDDGTGNPGQSAETQPPAEQTDSTGDPNPFRG